MCVRVSTRSAIDCHFTQISSNASVWKIKIDSLDTVFATNRCFDDFVVHCRVIKTQNGPESDIIRLVARVRAEILRDTTHTHTHSLKSDQLRSISFCLTAVWSCTRERVHRRLFFPCFISSTHSIVLRTTVQNDYAEFYSMWAVFFFFRMLAFSSIHFVRIVRFIRTLSCLSFGSLYVCVWWLFVLSQHAVVSGALGTHESNEKKKNIHEIYIKLSLI